MEEHGEDVYLYVLKSVLDTTDIKRDSKNQKDLHRLELLQQLTTKLPPAVIHQLPTIIFKCYSTSKEKEDKFFEIVTHSLKLSLNDEISVVIDSIYSSDSIFSSQGFKKKAIFVFS